MSAKARSRPRNEERVTFVVQAQERANVLLPVVALFDELKIEIEAIWMIRAKRTRNERISVTVEADREGAQEIAEYLSKVAGVLSVKTQTCAAALTCALSDTAE